MTRLSGDDIGFTFDGLKSKDFGIVRVSSSDRYIDPLNGNLSDRTISSAGMNGSYFFGSNVESLSFTINFAFEGISDTELRNLRLWFNKDRPCPLIFDENPYKVYMAKVQGDASITRLTFGKETINKTATFQIGGIGRVGSTTIKESGRYYNGEGSVQFVCYDPYAHTPNNKKYLSLYTDSNKSSWSAASGLKEQSNSKKVEDSKINTLWYYDAVYITGYNAYAGENKTKYSDYFAPKNYVGVEAGTYIRFYNPGDLEAPFSLTMSKEVFNSLTNLYVYGDASRKINFTSSKTLTGITKVVINMKTHLIEGFDENNKFVKVLNEYIVGGDFFNLPRSEGSLVFKGPNYETTDIQISYDYLYY